MQPARERSGERARPFNYLYWDFLVRNRDKLKRNPRLAMPYRTLDGMSAERIDRIRSDARRLLDRLEPAAPGRAGGAS